MFELTDSPIQISHLKIDPRAGAVVSFEGRVRIWNEGREVKGLEYESYPELALHTGLEIIKEAHHRFEIMGAFAIHRTGQLTIGEVAVLVSVSSEHRLEAFQAAEFIIDQIKHRVPIWKKETYTDGTSEWVLCQHQACSHG